MSTAQEAYSLFDVIFRGEVVAIEEVEFSYPNGNFSEYEVSFRVLESWKGVENPIVTVYAPIGSCSFDSMNIPINVGDPWLVYAEDQSEFFDGYLIFHICTRSRPLQDGQPSDIPVLDSLVEPTIFSDETESTSGNLCGNAGLFSVVSTIALLQLLSKSRYCRR